MDLRFARLACQQFVSVFTMGFLFTRLMRYFIFVALAFSLVQYMLKSMPYTFSPKAFRVAAENAAGAFAYLCDF